MASTISSTEGTDLERLHSEALQKLGRNVINFQKIEACLKYLLVVSDIEGSQSSVAAFHNKKEKRVKKMTLGKLAETVHATLFGEAATIQHQPPTDLSETWMSASIRLEIGRDEAIQRKRALSALVIERNNLIHHDLALFDHNSRQSCIELIKQLDFQNSRVLEQLNGLKSIVDSIKSTLSVFKSLVDSDEFLKILSVSPSGSDNSQ